MHAPDPDQLYGVKLASVIAGFCGSIVALSFLQTMTLWRAMAAVTTGTLSAAYVTPLAVDALHSQFDVVTVAAENGIAFWIGLVALRTAPTVVDGTARLVSRLLRTLPNERD